MAAKKDRDGEEVLSVDAEMDPVIDQDNKPEQETKEPEQTAPEPDNKTAERLTLVYIGPSIPYEKLRSSMILNGTEEEIGTFLEKIKEQYPEVTRLLVPPDRLTDALEKVARKGTILHKYYEDMLAKSRASRKG